jgi:hypothetical protein
METPNQSQAIAFSSGTTPEPGGCCRTMLNPWHTPYVYLKYHENVNRHQKIKRFFHNRYLKRIWLVDIWS